MGEVQNKKTIICVPGQRLCLSNENTVAGPGTYERHGYIHSMLAGVVSVTDKDKVGYHTHVSQFALPEITNPCHMPF